jgi:predicted short-subunit dehydrogenase-like oxidoreductase (DUF2520 family)
LRISADGIGGISAGMSAAGAEQANIAIVGTGRMAQALSLALCQAGWRVVCVCGRTPARAASLAASRGATVEALPIADAAERASHMVICVPDGAITEVGQLMASAVRASSQPAVRVVLHTSGNYGKELLGPLSDIGIACGALHPLQTLAGGDAPLEGVTFSVSGDAEAKAWGAAIAKSLRGEVVEIPAEARPLYHAAAVIASNYVVALLDAATELMQDAGLDQAQALLALAPLTRTSLENALTLGPRMALTGPVSRGDSATVATHLIALENRESANGSLQALYRAVGLRALEIAITRGLNEPDAARLRRLFTGEQA